VEISLNISIEFETYCEITLLVLTSKVQIHTSLEETIFLI